MFYVFLCAFCLNSSVSIGRRPIIDRTLLVLSPEFSYKCFCTRVSLPQAGLFNTNLVRHDMDTFRIRPKIRIIFGDTCLEVFGLRGYPNSREFPFVSGHRWTGWTAGQLHAYRDGRTRTTSILQVLFAGGRGVRFRPHERVNEGRRIGVVLPNDGNLAQTLGPRTTDGPVDLVWKWTGKSDYTVARTLSIPAETVIGRLRAAFVLHNNGSVGNGSAGAERRCFAREWKTAASPRGGGAVAKALSAFPTRSVPSESEQKRDGVPV